MAKLVPCPKCGKNQKRTFSVKCIFETQYKVKCLFCGFETDPFESKEEAHLVWNDLHPKKTDLPKGVNTHEHNS